MDSTLKRTWAEIDLDALEHNYRVLRAQAGPQARFLGVVKADAYGHGAIQVARTLEKLGAEYLAVSNIDEARELRLGGVALPILQLGLTPTDEVPEILQNCVTQTIYSESAAQAFSRAAQALGGSIKVHIKLDTGMSRLGFSATTPTLPSPWRPLDGCVPCRGWRWRASSPTLPPPTSLRQTARTTPGPSTTASSGW